MLQAWITAPRGSLYFAAPATAYNLETLRSHVRALRDEDPSRTCLSLNLGGAEDGVVLAKISALVAELTLEGIQVRFAVEAGEPRPSLLSLPSQRPRRRRRSGGDTVHARARAHG